MGSIHPLFFKQKARVVSGTRNHAKYLCIQTGNAMALTFDTGANGDSGSTHKMIILRKEGSTGNSNSIILNRDILNADVDDYVISIEALLDQRSLDLDEIRS